MTDWADQVHRVMTSLALARLGAPTQFDADDLVLPDVLNRWQDRGLGLLDLMLDAPAPRRVWIVENVMMPRPEWRPAWHVTWQALRETMEARGYVLERVIAVDYWGRRPFRRTPKWAHVLVMPVALLMEFGAVIVVPWRRARHTAWRFRAE